MSKKSLTKWGFFFSHPKRYKYRPDLHTKQVNLWHQSTHSLVVNTASQEFPWLFSFQWNTGHSLFLLLFAWIWPWLARRTNGNSSSLRWPEVKSTKPYLPKRLILLKSNYIEGEESKRQKLWMNKYLNATRKIYFTITPSSTSIKSEASSFKLVNSRTASPRTIPVVLDPQWPVGVNLCARRRRIFERSRLKLFVRHLLIGSELWRRCVITITK